MNWLFPRQNRRLPRPYNPFGQKNLLVASETMFAYSRCSRIASRMSSNAASWSKENFARARTAKSSLLVPSSAASPRVDPSYRRQGVSVICRGAGHHRDGPHLSHSVSPQPIRRRRRRRSMSCLKRRDCSAEVACISGTGEIRLSAALQYLSALAY